jgi:hypothetical protein
LQKNSKENKYENNEKDFHDIHFHNTFFNRIGVYPIDGMNVLAGRLKNQKY